jgi:GPH family glycoside/pentoside/hexuronide:cation symporter
MNTLKAINKVGYGVGDLANGLTFGMSATFLLAFYTDVLGITAAAAGTLFLVARIWDAVNDPMMGTLADRMFARRRAKNAASGKKLDKFRPFLLKGSWPVAVAAVLMFIAPSGLSMTGKLIWAYATYITWGMAYTFINIPYGSLGRRHDPGSGGAFQPLDCPGTGRIIRRHVRPGSGPHPAGELCR